jgi:hypothetical protein
MKVENGRLRRLTTTLLDRIVTVSHFGSAPPSTASVDDSRINFLLFDTPPNLKYFRLHIYSEIFEIWLGVEKNGIDLEKKGIDPTIIYLISNPPHVTDLGTTVGNPPERK